MIICFQLLLSTYRQYVFRGLLVALSLLIAATGLSTVLVLNAKADKSFSESQLAALSGVTMRIVNKPGNFLTKQDYARLRRQGFDNAVAVSHQTVSLPVTGSASLKVRLTGIDSFAAAGIHNHTNTNSPEQSMGLISRNLSLIHRDFAHELGLVEGQHIQLPGGQVLPPLNILEVNGLGRQILLDISTLYRLFPSSQLSEILIVGGAFEAINSKLPEHLLLEKLLEPEDKQQMTRSFRFNLLAMSLLMFIVCMFVAGNALNLVMAKRLPNLKVARQLGISRQQIYRALAAEVLLLCIIIAPVGTMLGFYFAQMASAGVDATLSDLFGVTVNFQRISFASVFSQTMLACLIGCALAQCMPFYRLNQQLYRVDSSSRTQQAWLLYSLIILCSLIAGLLYFLSNSLLAAFWVIALVLVTGCALAIVLLPYVLAKCLKWSPDSWPLWRWCLAESIRLSQHSKIAYCAFFIALVSNLGMNLMVDSFRQATDDWLTQRLSASAYLVLDKPADLTSQAELADPEIQLIPEFRTEGLFKGKPIQIRSLPADSLQQAHFPTESLKADGWQRFAQGKGTLINQQFANRYLITLGQSIAVELEEDKPNLLTVEGIYYDYGNPVAQMRLPLSVMRTALGETTRYAVHAQSAADLARLKVSLQALDIKYSWYDTDTILDLSMRTFDRTFAISSALNLVTLLVAAFSLACSVLILELDEIPRRTLLRSMGISRQKLFILALSQYLVLCIFIALIAIPFAILLSWLLINLINVRAFHWAYPLLLDPVQIITAVTLSLLVVITITALPLRNAFKHPLAQDLKWFS